LAAPSIGSRALERVGDAREREVLPNRCVPTPGGAHTRCDGASRLYGRRQELTAGTPRRLAMGEWLRTKSGGESNRPREKSRAITELRCRRSLHDNPLRESSLTLDTFVMPFEWLGREWPMVYLDARPFVA
jgi:hypothetical protein